MLFRVREQEGRVPVEDDPTRAGVPGNAAVEVRSKPPGDGVPAEDGGRAVGFQDAQAGGVGAAEVEGGVHQQLQDALRAGLHRVHQRDEGPALGLVLRRAGRPASSSVIRTSSRPTITLSGESEAGMATPLLER